MVSYLSQVKIHGLKDLLRAFYEENRITKDDMKINPLLYSKETKLSFEKCVSLSPVSGWMSQKKDLFKTRDEAITLLWGCPNDAYDVNVEKGSSSYLYTFRTVASPPHNWFYAISQKYMYLTFEVIIQDENGNVFTLLFEKGERKEKKEEKKEEKEESSSDLFKSIVSYLDEKEIDSKKYMKRMYEKHYQGAEKNVEHIDYEGLLEDFVDKVKIHKYLQKRLNGNDSHFYEKSRAFVEYVLSDKK
jgi:hypothetical protein